MKTIGADGRVVYRYPTSPRQEQTVSTKPKTGRPALRILMQMLGDERAYAQLRYHLGRSRPIEVLNQYALPELVAQENPLNSQEETCAAP